MTFRDEAEDLKLTIRTEGYALTARDREHLRFHLESLERLVRPFPVADLHVDVHRHPRSGDFHVTMNLRLPRRSLFTGERDATLSVACERCLGKLRGKVKHLKNRLDAGSGSAKGTGQGEHPVVPDAPPALAALIEAQAAEDFAAFRDRLAPYDEALTLRVGRWVERYPELQARLGRDWVVSELVDEVCLEAFERFEERPVGRLGAWLESLIDPAMKRIVADPEAAQRMLGFLRSASPEGQAASGPNPTR